MSAPLALQQPAPAPAAHVAPTWSQQGPTSWSIVAAATQAAPLPAPSPAPATPVKAEPPAPAAPAAPTRSLHPQAQAPAHAPAHTGWIIQIGAFGSASEAKQHLDAAQSKVSLLGHADPFTETVTKGDKTYYRARFAGLQKDQAEETCRKLRRSDFACITVKN
jgi:D-alanyl-D-alanine carboxypeptidase